MSKIAPEGDAKEATTTSGSLGTEAVGEVVSPSSGNGRTVHVAPAQATTVPLMAESLTAHNAASDAAADAAAAKSDSAASNVASHQSVIHPEGG